MRKLFKYLLLAAVIALALTTFFACEGGEYYDDYSEYYDDYYDGQSAYPGAATHTTHTYGAWVVTEDATCTETGTQERACSICGAKETQEIDALGHDIIRHDVKQATCTDKGWNEYETCSRCDYSTYEEIEAIGHDIIHHDAQVATCTEIGWSEYETCSRCDYTTYKEIEAIGHDIIHHDEQGVTCTEIGWGEYETCSRCDYTTYEEIEALGHDIVLHVAQVATCTEIGWNEYETCSRCDHTTYEEIEPFGHDYNVVVSVPTCTEQGYTTHTCSRCGDSYADTYTEALGHDYNSTVMAPTECEEGYTTHCCEHCGHCYIDMIIYPEGTENLSYTLKSDDTYEVTGCIDNKFSRTNLVIPTKHLGKPVTGIQSGAFSGCSSLQSITIPFVGAKTGKTDRDTYQYPFGYIFGKSSYTGGTATQQYYYGSSTSSTTSSTYYIPTSLRCVTVTGENVLYGAFYNCRHITSISIGKSVTGIASSAFYGCSALESMTIPFVGNRAGVTSSDTYQYPFGYIFGTSSYTGGTATKQYYYGYSTSSATSSTYYIPSSLRSVTVTGGNILYRAFYNCSMLTSIIIPDSVEGIGERAFYNCTGFISITIPDSVTSIGADAFYNCNGLTSVYYTGDIASWCGITFGVSYSNPLQYAHNIYINNELQTEIVIPNMITEIKARAFHGWNGTSITIPDSVTSIGNYAFYACTANIQWGDNPAITTIGSYAFAGYMGTSITIPDSVTSINSGAFSGCSSLVTMTIPFVGNRSGVTNDDTYQYPFGYIFGTSSYTGGTATQQNYYGSSTSTITSSTCYIPSSLRSITVTGGNILRGAFYNCSILTSITIPDSVTSIGYDAFYGCTANIQWGDLPIITTIDRHSFSGYMGTSITIPDSVESIGERAFYNCTGLTSINIPDSVKGIGSGAFSGCSSLQSITIPFVGAEAGKTSSDTYQYPFGYIFGTSGYTDGTATKQYYYGYSISSVTSSTYYIPSSLRSVTVTGGNILYRAFEQCNLLTNIMIGNSVISIGEYAFNECSGLTSITLSDNITSIGAYAFYHCAQLASITIPNSVTSIGTAAFSGCTGLTGSITIPNSVTSIDSSAFNGCTGLTSVTIGSGVTRIESTVFANCTELTSIIISDSVTSIGSNPFGWRSNLVDIIFGGTKAQWNQIEKHNYWSSNSGDFIIRCTDGILDKNGENHVHVANEAFDMTPLCTEQKYFSYTCTKCGEEVEIIIEAPGHNYNAIVAPPTCTEQGYTTHTCSRCGDSYVDTYIEAPGHNYNAIVTPPTCTEQGYSTHTCSRCGDSYVDTYIGPLGHDVIHHNAKEETCTEIGWEAYDTCSRCDYTTYVEIPAPGHDVIHHNAKEETCTEISWEAYDTCSKCNYTTYVEIPAPGHNYNAIITPPTCTEQGYTTHTCNRCGDSYVDTYTGPLGHDLIHHNAKEESCTEIGWEAYDTCSRCDYTTYVEIPAPGHDVIHHNAKEETCTEISWKAYDTCSRCDYTTYVEIHAPGHDVIHHNAKEETCTEIGWEAYDTCSRCDYTTYVEIPAPGHNYNAIITPPTCMAQGYTTHTCSRCENTYVDTYTEPLGHNYNSTVIPPTEWEEGYTIQDCSRCGDSYIYMVIYPEGAGNLIYSLKSDDTYEVSGCIENSSKLVIPSKHFGKPVTSIQCGAFSGCSYLQSIVIPFVGNRSGVTSSDKYQYPFGYIFGTSSYTGGTRTQQYFYGSSFSSTSDYYYLPTSLRSVTVTGGNILYGAFYNCSNLTSITIGDAVTSIGYRAFFGCDGLTNVNHTGDIASWCRITFVDNPLLYGNLYINNEIISGKIVLPNTVTTIPSYTFRNSNITSITIPDSVTSIGAGAFVGCTGLTGSITIPEGVTSIFDSTFSGCTGLTGITIPDSVTSIGSYAFRNCTGLTSVTIPDGMTSIGYGAFKDCYRLVEVYNKSSLKITNNGENGSVGCYAKEIYTEPYTSKLSVDSNGYILYTDGDDISLIGYTGSETDLILPAGITEIIRGAFYNCSSLTSIRIPYSVTRIEEAAFYGCSNLKNVTFDNNSQLISIGDNAFRDCGSLTTIIIPAGVTSIGGFYNCGSLKSVTLPSSLTAIGKYTFFYCSNLTSITFTGTKSQWNAISKGNYWNIETGNYTIHCTDGDIST